MFAAIFPEMEGDQTSVRVVVPDISEQLTNRSDERGRGGLASEDHANPVSVTQVTVPVSSVPVSLPVGSLIGVSSSGTFNVITSDQLQVNWKNPRWLSFCLFVAVDASYFALDVAPNPS